jgi:hypothetical protein
MLECHREYVEVTSLETGESRVLREEKELCQRILAASVGLHRAVACIRIGSGFYLQANFKGRSEHCIKWSCDGPEFQKEFLLGCVRSWNVDEIVVVEVSVLELIQSFNEIRLSRSLRMPAVSQDSRSFRAPPDFSDYLLPYQEFLRKHHPDEFEEVLRRAGLPPLPTTVSPTKTAETSGSGWLGCGCLITIIFLIWFFSKAC